jgi:ABC-type protease/lipase transport system fused ATPase/permease subunit
MLQSGGLAVGALLVIEGAMSPGALIASSIILGRIFACFDAGIAHWRDFSAARESHDRIAALLAR